MALYSKNSVYHIWQTLHCAFSPQNTRKKFKYQLLTLVKRNSYRWNILSKVKAVSGKLYAKSSGTFLRGWDVVINFPSVISNNYNFYSNHTLCQGVRCTANQEVLVDYLSKKSRWSQAGRSKNHCHNQFKYSSA